MAEVECWNTHLYTCIVSPLFSPLKHQQIRVSLVSSLFPTARSVYNDDVIVRNLNFHWNFAERIQSERYWCCFGAESIFQSGEKIKISRYTFNNFQKYRLYQQHVHFESRGEFVQNFLGKLWREIKVTGGEIWRSWYQNCFWYSWYHQKSFTGQFLHLFVVMTSLMTSHLSWWHLEDFMYRKRHALMIS